MLNLNLPDLDGKKTQKTIEAAFEKFKIYQFTTFDEMEASLTASYDLREGSSGGTVTDQTAKIATYNVDTPAQRRMYMDKIRKCVSRLPRQERMLIEVKYMSEDERVTDLEVYNTHLLVSVKKYESLRRDAFYKLAFMFNDIRLISIDDLIRE